MVTSDRFVLISGCSAGGKSSLLAELGRRGYATVEEPGRRIVREELERGGSALPWSDLEAFLRKAFKVALDEFMRASSFTGWVFFDRGLIDAAAGIERATGQSMAKTLGPLHRYHRRVFVVPPWPDIHVTDQEPRHELSEAVVEYEHLLKAFQALGYDVTVLPKVSVVERADLVVQALASSRATTMSAPAP